MAKKDYLKDCKSAIRSVNNNLIKLSDPTIKVDKYETTILQFYGGCNGSGSWDNYFRILSDLVQTLKQKYKIDAWLVNIKVDCLDDVFSIEFGIKDIDEEDDD